MINTRSPLVVFPVAGLVSGLCSGFSVILQPLGVIAPGILFGAALVYSLDSTIVRLSSRQQIGLIMASTGAYFTAIVAMLSSARLPGINNGLLDSAFAGSIGGGVGALIIATSLAVAVPIMSPRRTVIVVTLAGVCFGAVFLLCGVYISDHTALGHPFDDFVSFPLWQSGVASVVPFCQRRSTSDKAA